MTKSSQIIYLLLGIVLLSWPLFVAENSMEYWISPNNGHAGSGIAAALKVASLTLGAGAIAVGLIAENKKYGGKIWLLRIALAVVLFGLAMYWTVRLDFDRAF